MTRPTSKQSVRFACAVASTIAWAALPSLFLAVRPAQAATYTWTGNSNSIWSTSGNWSPSTAVPGVGDEADFSGTFSNPPQNVNASLGQFHALGTLAESFTTAIGSLSLFGTNNAVLIDYNSSVANNAVTLMGGTIAVAASQSWTNNNGNGNGFAMAGSGDYSLIVTSNVSTGGATLTLAGSGATALTGLVSGAGGISINNNGLAALSGTNTFTGSVSITQGILMVPSIANMGTPQPLGSGTGALTLGGSSSSGELYLLPSANGATNRSVAINAGGGTILVASSTDTFSGVFSGSGGLTKAGAGTLTLTNSNTYTGSTAVAGGVLHGGASNAFASSSNLTISGGTLDATGFAQTVKSLTVASSGALNLTIGDLLACSNSASFGGTLNLYGTTSGTRELVGYSAYSGNFATVSGIPSGYMLDYTSNQLELTYSSSNNSILGASASSVALGRAMLNHVPTTSVVISLTSGTSATGFSASASGGATAAAGNNGPGAVTASTSGTVTIGLTNATGSYSGTVQVQNSGDSGSGPTSAGPGLGNAQSPISIGVTGTVVANRVVTSTSASFGVVHAGQSVSQGITLSTTGNDSQFTRVTVANGGVDPTNGLSVGGGSNPTFNGPAISDTRLLGGVLNSAGIINGTVTLTTSGEGLTGESPINVAVSYSAQVFSGNAVWTGAADNSWNTNVNFNDLNAAGVHAAAGVFAGFNDTLVLNNSASNRTLNLNGATPCLSSLAIGTSSGSGYTVAQGTGGNLVLNNGANPAALSVTGGQQTISAPVSLASPLGVSFSGPSAALTISGNVTEATPGQSLTITGAGQLTLSGTSTYTGGTTVSQGTLNVAGAMLGGAVLINGGAVLTGAGTVQGGITGYAGSAIVATGTLALGNSTSYTGFSHAGTLAVGGNNVTLNSAQFANVGVSTTLGGGTLAAPNGIYLGGGCALSGMGAVNGKIAAGYGSTIAATGNLTLGDSTSPAGFTSDGELYTGANTVTLRSVNQAVLGSLTQVGAAAVRARSPPPTALCSITATTSSARGPSARPTPWPRRRSSTATSMALAAV